MSIQEVIEELDRMFIDLEINNGDLQKRKALNFATTVLGIVNEHGLLDDYYKNLGKPKKKDEDIAHSIYDAVTNKLIALGTDLDVNQAIQGVILDFMYN